jgi:hypothetical protein
MSSGTERTGIEGCTTRVFGAVPIRPIGSKSVRGS